MTLTKAVTELIAELQRPDLTEEEKKALEKYQHWLFGIKKTVSNSTDWHPYPQEKPTEIKNYILTTPSHGLRFGSWTKEKDRFMDAGKTINVIAWAELPQPYEGADA